MSLISLRVVFQPVFRVFHLSTRDGAMRKRHRCCFSRSLREMTNAERTWEGACLRRVRLTVFWNKNKRNNLQILQRRLI